MRSLPATSSRTEARYAYNDAVIEVKKDIRVNLFRRLFGKTTTQTKPERVTASHDKLQAMFAELNLIGAQLRPTLDTAPRIESNRACEIAIELYGIGGASLLQSALDAVQGRSGYEAARCLEIRWSGLKKDGEIIWLC